MTEREQAIKIANDWLDFKMNPLTQMVHGDPDCDACVLARQFIRAIEALTSPSITCPRCGRTSYNFNDVRERYCGFCHAFHEDMR